MPVSRVVLTLFACCLIFVTQPKAQTSAAKSDRKPVIVELFTSEGCSSCPPADALLQNLEEQQPVAGAEVIGLEEHVDYWNHQGWIDPYSSPEWTQRQMVYATLYKKGQAYTPEMVVDGKSQFVGSDERKAEFEIEKAAARAETNVTITCGKVAKNRTQRFHVSVGQLAGNTRGDVAEVWLAVTEEGLHTPVTRGENAGHVLYHSAVLRSLRKIGVANARGESAAFVGDARVKFNSHWDQKNLHVVVFVQEKKGRKILGAAETVPN